MIVLEGKREREGQSEVGADIKKMKIDPRYYNGACQFIFRVSSGIDFYLGGVTHKV